MNSKLTIGWKTNNNLDPRFWIENEDPRIENVTNNDLVEIPSEKMACHTAIIAQSGSGKSFFLGRLIEEILIKTKSNCLILDPNSDFRSFYQIVDESLWTNPAYDKIKRRGKLTQEKRSEVFSGKWKKLPISVKSLDFEEHSKLGELKLSWISAPVSVVFDGIDSTLRTNIEHCHSFVQGYSNLIALSSMLKYPTSSDKEENIDLLIESETLLQKIRENPDDSRKTLENKFDEILQLAEKRNEKEDIDWTKLSLVAMNSMSDIIIGASALPSIVPGIEIISAILKLKKSFSGKKSENQFRKKAILGFDRIFELTRYICETSSNLYFSRAKFLIDSGLFCSDLHSIRNQANFKNKLEIVDLPSIKNPELKTITCQMILNKVWNNSRAEWKDALLKKKEEDIRVPTFIVIDEAHNIIPSNPRTEAEKNLCETVRRIVAEGRKFGLFLILMTQRPEKIDSLVLSECENIGIMKIGNGSVLSNLKTFIGADEIPKRLLEKCIEFPIGRILLTGPWCSETTKIAYSAARRTIEGGRNLNEGFWAHEPS